MDSDPEVVEHPTEYIFDDLVVYDKIAVDNDDIENLAERHNDTRTAYVYDILDSLANYNYFSVKRDFIGDPYGLEDMPYSSFDLSEFDEFEAAIAKQYFDYKKP